MEYVPRLLLHYCVSALLGQNVKVLLDIHHFEQHMKAVELSHSTMLCAEYDFFTSVKHGQNQCVKLLSIFHVSVDYSDICFLQRCVNHICCTTLFVFNHPLLKHHSKMLGIAPTSYSQPEVAPIKPAPPHCRHSAPLQAPCIESI